MSDFPGLYPATKPKFALDSQVWIHPPPVTKSFPFCSGCPFPHELFELETTTSWEPPIGEGPPERVPRTTVGVPPLDSMPGAGEPRRGGAGIGGGARAATQRCRAFTVISFTSP